jgi:RNA polymerase sigma factor (TIGR02999 family)
MDGVLRASDGRFRGPKQPREDAGSPSRLRFLIEHMNVTQSITETLMAWRDGSDGAEALLTAEIYQALKRMAGQRVAGQRAGATLSPTALVHEAVVRMLGSDVDWQSRAHFFALAALQMRAVLVDHARSVSAAKRGGGWVAVTLDQDLADMPGPEALLELHDALDRLAVADPRPARVVELTYFGGLTSTQVADVCAVSVATVERDLKFARAWLRTELAQ